MQHLSSALQSNDHQRRMYLHHNFLFPWNYWIKSEFVDLRVEKIFMNTYSYIWLTDMVLFSKSNPITSSSNISGCLKRQLGTWPKNSKSDSSSASNTTQVFFPALSNLIVKFLLAFCESLLLYFFSSNNHLKVRSYHVSYDASISQRNWSNRYRNSHLKHFTWHPTINGVVSRYNSFIFTFLLV